MKGSEARADQRVVVTMVSAEVNGNWWFCGKTELKSHVPTTTVPSPEISNTLGCFRAPTTGQYTILATSFMSEETGRYTIRVERSAGGEGPGPRGYSAGGE